MSTAPFTNYAGTLTLARVRIDRGGYGPDGTYWGQGMPLWRAEAQTDDRYYTTGDDAYLRAYNKAHAGDKLHRDNPKATIKGWKSQFPKGETWTQGAKPKGEVEFPLNKSIVGTRGAANKNSIGPWEQNRSAVVKALSADLYGAVGVYADKAKGIVVIETNGQDVPGMDTDGLQDFAIRELRQTFGRTGRVQPYYDPKNANAIVSVSF